ncbi:MAG: hypothetical protein ACRDQH_02490 [Pseudonocardiaceae bacterium]
MSGPSTDPPLYDVAHALGELESYRATAASDPVAAQSVKVSAELARHMARHFPAGQCYIAGRAVIIAAASLGTMRDFPVEVVCNIAGLAGQQLCREGGR